ncbi:MAG: hypothetical protein JWO38_5163 [Gemmataceae bacterium]|nr:hypothetical protein [Gemmataceae bacterium]
MARRRDDDDDDYDDRPRRRRRYDDDDDDDRPRRSRGSGSDSGTGVLIAVGVGVGILFLIGAGVAAFLLFRGEKGKPDGGDQQAVVVAPPAPLVRPAPRPNSAPINPINPIVPQPDPVDAPPKLGAGVVPIPPVINPQVTQIVFGGGEGGFTAIISNKSQGVGRQIDVVKTATGEARGQILVDSVTDKEFAASPDGKWLAVVGSAPFEGNPLTLYAVANGQQVHQVTPYPRTPATLSVPDLIWTAFLPENQLLTINTGGGFDVWSVPGLKRTAGSPPGLTSGPVLVVNGFTHTPTNFALTPDGKTLALFNGTGFTFYDPATATETARTEPVMKAGGSANFSGAALQADGSRFACPFTTFTPKATAALGVWDAKTGQRMSASSPKNTLGIAGFGWWGSNHLLLWQGGISTADVLNVESGQAVGRVKFKGIGKVGTVAPSDKLWGVTGGVSYDPVNGAAYLLKADAPATIPPGTQFELSPGGLWVKDQVP